MGDWARSGTQASKYSTLTPTTVLGQKYFSSKLKVLSKNLAPKFIHQCTQANIHQTPIHFPPKLTKRWERPRLGVASWDQKLSEIKYLSNCHQQAMISASNKSTWRCWQGCTVLDSSVLRWSKLFYASKFMLQMWVLSQFTCLLKFGVLQ